MPCRLNARTAATLLLVMMIAISAVIVPIGAAAADVSTPYRVDMINGDFEDGGYRTSLSSWVATGWEPWYQQGDATFYREPEFGAMFGRQRYNGEGSQRWFTTWATHNCGIFQRVIVPENANLTFSTWMISWSANNTDEYGKSDSGYSKWVGIDPYGGNNPWSPNIIWSQPNTVMDKWVQLQVSAKAAGKVITVFSRGEAAFPVKHNTLVMDEARLFSDIQPSTSTSAPSATPASGAPGVAGESLFFAATGKSVSGEWLEWIRANGGIDNNGLPRSNVMKDPVTGGWVQYFQRVVLDYFPNNPAPYKIQRRLLGDIMQPGADPALANPPANSANYVFFPASTDPSTPTGLGHGVSNTNANGTYIGFKDYFDSHGGVTAFGYPKEEAKLVDGWWTQRFQAAVFQYHPENDKDGLVPGTNIPYRTYIVQLLLLGDSFVANNNIAVQ